MHLADRSILKLAVTLLFFFAACKESAPQKAASNEKAEDVLSNPSPSSSPSPSPSSDPEPCSVSTSSDNETSTESENSTATDEDVYDPFALTGSTVVKKVKHKHKAKAAKAKSPKAKSAKKGFGLTDSVSFDSDIKSIIDSKCVSCHGSGGTPPELTSYSLVKTNLSTSISQIDQDKMPTSTPLSSSQKEKFHAWQDAGAPETSSDSSSSSDDDTSSSTDSGCDTSTSTDDSDDEASDGFEDLNNPPELAECKNKGKVYDRKNSECHKASVAEFSCDHSGIVAAFKKVGVSAEAKLSSIEGDGYKIDQCGMYESEPIVYFTKRGDTDTDTVSLKIKKLCKPSASVCQ